MIGLRVIVIVTPVADTRYLDKVICNKKRQIAINAEQQDINQNEAAATYLRPI